MSTQPTTQSQPSAAAEGITERVDPVSCLDERVRREATPVGQAPVPAPVEPGRYLEARGPGKTLLVRLEQEGTPIGRGLSAHLRLCEHSASGAHPRPGTASAS